MPGYIPPAPKVVLEGDYSTWTLKWNTLVYDITASVNYAIVNVDGDLVCFVSYKTSLIKLSTGELLAELSTLSYGDLCEYVGGSILGKYLVVTTAADTIKIYKDGVLKQTITPVSGDAIGGVGISSNGKYVVVGLKTADKVYCYEGN